LNISSPGDDRFIYPGEEPVTKGTTEFEQADPSKSSPPEEESIRPGEAPTRKNTTEVEFALPAWLRKLRRQTDDKPPADEPVEPEESLSEIQETPEIPETSDANLPVSSAEEEVADWLSGLEQTAQEEDETPAWLSNIKDIPKKEQPLAEPTSESASLDDDNWLDRLREDTPEQELGPEKKHPETPQQEPVFGEGIPEWMKKIQDEVDARTTVSRPEEEGQIKAGIEESPDWLNRLQAETQSFAAVNESSSSRQAEEKPDWLEKMSIELPESTEENPPSETETPDWLRKLQTENQAFSEEVQPSEAEPPDLLKNIPVEENIPSETETHDWPKDISAEAPVSAEESISPETETPDWLKDVEVEPQALAQEYQSFGTEAPDWLMDISAGGPPIADESVLPNLGMVDWQKEKGVELQESAEVDNLVDKSRELSDIRSNLPSSESGGLDELTSFNIEPDLLSTLKVEDEINQQVAGEPLKPSLSSQKSESELVPDWLQNINKTDTFSSGTNDLIPDEVFSSESESGELIPAELGDWLSTRKEHTSATQPEEGIPETELNQDSIQPAELPSWVQAMRPIESMLAEAGVPDKRLEQVTEKAGPLAGLRGVLPATPGLGKLRKPLNYSIKLRVTEDQNQQADQLVQMLGVEAQAKSTTQVGSKLPQRILRWVVAILMILAVGLPAFSGIQITPAPSNYPPELVAAREVLLGLSPSSPVLLVFDYEPAYSGELEASAAPLVDNLLFFGARLAILSTSPTGPTLAEHFLKTTQGLHNYQSGQQYANLGYLAGGASGVLSFALNPSQTIPYALDGSQPWETPLLQDIHTLADFKAVIILTDNSDTARIWVEQAGTILGQTPLLMAISAQAEPMIRPYYDSKQIKGLVTGLAGGKAYEQALQLSGLGQQYWDSFSSGLFIAELIIIFGSLWSIISVWRKRKSVHEEEA
jgi:hypothetical protein